MYEHLAELLLKVLILALEAYNFYKLEKILKATIKIRGLENRPNQLNSANDDAER